jgi:hypothetical protein
LSRDRQPLAFRLPFAHDLDLAALEVDVHQVEPYALVFDMVRFLPIAPADPAHFRWFLDRIRLKLSGPLSWRITRRRKGAKMSISSIALESVSQKAQRQIRDLEQEIRVLEKQVGHLTLASIAMAEILRDHLSISGEVIEAKIREIDLRDGKLDGTFRPSAKTCKECGRVSSPMSASCLYCGTMLTKESSLIGL